MTHTCFKDWSQSKGSTINKNGAQTAHVQMFSRDSVQIKLRLKDNLDLHGYICS